MVEYIYCICSNAFTAEEKKRELEKKIESIKAEYENEFGRSYDKDVSNMMKLSKKVRWEEIYEYQDKYDELGYTTITVNEHEVIC